MRCFYILFYIRIAFIDLVRSVDFTPLKNERQEVSSSSSTILEVEESSGKSTDITNSRSSIFYRRKSKTDDQKRYAKSERDSVARNRP